MTTKWGLGQRVCRAQGWWLPSHSDSISVWLGLCFFATQEVTQREFSAAVGGRNLAGSRTGHKSTDCTASYKKLCQTITGLTGTLFSTHTLHRIITQTLSPYLGVTPRKGHRGASGLNMPHLFDGHHLKSSPSGFGDRGISVCSGISPDRPAAPITRCNTKKKGHKEVMLITHRHAAPITRCNTKKGTGQ